MYEMIIKPKSLQGMAIPSDVHNSLHSLICYSLDSNHSVFNFLLHDFVPQRNV